MTDFELMELRVGVLFKHDTDNQMTVINEPPYDVAPRIFIGGTKLGSIIRYSNTLNRNVVEEIDRVIGTSPGEHLAEVIKVISKDRPIDHVSIGPAYVLPDMRERQYSKAVQITNENKDILKNHFKYTFEDFEFKQPCFVIIENGIPVSLCCSARQTSQADEASVFTHEDYRGRGFGIDVTTAWAQEVQKQGRIALYSTSWDNFASQSVARKLKVIQYGTDIHMN